MPYISQHRRKMVRPMSDEPAETAGELNFQITSLINDYLNAKIVQYSTINDILGVLDAAAKEFYRRVAAPYEDKKIAENGDVFSKLPPQPILEDHGFQKKDYWAHIGNANTGTTFSVPGAVYGNSTGAHRATITYTFPNPRPPEDPPEEQLTLF